ncbi:MAG: type II toxin-antitoxin system RelE/ParE family toxin [Acidobacteriaceae bacterium]
MQLPAYINWTPLAESQAGEIHQYIAADNSASADRQLHRVLESIQGLSLFLEKGRTGRVSGTRELVVPGTPYIFVYRLKAAGIQILSILHGARRWPAQFPQG